MIVQVIAIALLAATFVPSIAAKDEGQFPVAAIGGAAVVALVVLVGLTIKWKPDDSKTVSSPDTTAATGDSTAASVASGPQAVTIKDFAFAAPSLNIAKGTTVTWTNQDNVGHSVVSSDKTTFKSAKLTQGQAFSFTFDTDGTFAYICGIHPYMQGTITVTG